MLLLWSQIFSFVCFTPQCLSFLPLYYEYSLAADMALKNKHINKSTHTIIVLFKNTSFWVLCGGHIYFILLGEDILNTLNKLWFFNVCNMRCRPCLFLLQEFSIPTLPVHLFAFQWWYKYIFRLHFISRWCYSVITQISTVQYLLATYTSTIGLRLGFGLGLVTFNCA